MKLIKIRSSIFVFSKKMSFIEVIVHIDSHAPFRVSVPSGLDHDALISFISNLQGVQGIYGNLTIRHYVGKINKYILILSYIGIIIKCRYLIYWNKLVQYT
jgi:hypothetical protein